MTFFKDGVQVAVAASVVVASGTNVVTSEASGSILANGAGDDNPQEFFTIHLPLTTAIDRVTFTSTGKSNGSNNNVTLMYRDWAWVVPRVALTKGSSLDPGSDGTVNAGDQVTHTSTVPSRHGRRRRGPRPVG
ncbi:MAG: hypothetical protein AAFQ42_01085 [Pseudomonadota bacterium]